MRLQLLSVNGPRARASRCACTRYGFNGNLVGMGLGSFLAADVDAEPLVALHNMLYIIAGACCAVIARSLARCVSRWT